MFFSLLLAYVVSGLAVMIDFEQRHTKISETELMQVISKLVNLGVFVSDYLQQILMTRVVGSENHERVKNFIVDKLEELKWTVEVDAFTALTPLGRRNFSNVIASENIYSPRKLVLAAHYDTISVKGGFLLHTELLTGAPPLFIGEYIGATDAAVSVAMLLYVASVINKISRGPKDELSLQLIFFDGEEAFLSWSSTDSLYGSRHLAGELEKKRVPCRNSKACTHLKPTQLQAIELFVLLDLLGAADPQFFCTDRTSLRSFIEFSRIESVLKTNGLLDKHTTSYFQNPHITYYDNKIQDDHIPFKVRNVSVVHLIPVPFPQVWHTLSDNFEALDLPTISNLLKILIGYVAEYTHCYNVPKGQVEKLEL
ncbi:glutaminyl-peptide cyclotransferase-like isoform X2 [Zophobas morio]|uniref:glutaminyl-peptide cyclotransferase-like isoform X2 n=1 Tax=Zophobas morio TaxID=2755281 RepID=UPI003082CEB8